MLLSFLAKFTCISGSTNFSSMRSGASLHALRRIFQQTHSFLLSRRFSSVSLKKFERWMVNKPVLQKFGQIRMKVVQKFKCNCWIQVFHHQVSLSIHLNLWPSAEMPSVVSSPFVTRTLQTLRSSLLTLVWSTSSWVNFSHSLSSVCYRKLFFTFWKNHFRSNPHYFWVKA